MKHFRVTVSVTQTYTTVLHVPDRWRIAGQEYAEMVVNQGDEDDNPPHLEIEQVVRVDEEGGEI
tara:strand:+ start:1033 stop:1224 length:192 start_codon:yes stop_codon:yes gene_type:complete